MPDRSRRTLLFPAVALAGLLAVGDLLILTARGARAPAWAHLWCSPSSLHSASRHGEQAAGGFLAALPGFLRTILPHWPHILPVVIALATLVYLWRANARYQAHRSAPLVERGDPAL